MQALKDIRRGRHVPSSCVSIPSIRVSCKSHLYFGIVLKQRDYSHKNFYSGYMYDRRIKLYVKKFYLIFSDSLISTTHNLYILKIRRK